MNDQTSVRILELLASKICHDLISPVGAVANGVEILEELGPEDAEDVVSLISFSATQANAKLKTLRMAYGLGGSDESIKPADVHTTFEDFIAGEKRLSQDWDAHADLGVERPTGFPKLLLCAMLLATEALPKGGVISVDPETENTIVIKATGENANFREGFVHALEHKTPDTDIDPKLVHAYITGLLAKTYGFTVDVSEEQESFILLRLTIPNVS